MTIKQCIKKQGWQLDANISKPCRSMDVNVAFENNEATDGLDETQFHINAYDTNELSELFSDFCKDNNIPKDTVVNVIIVQTYETNV